ncbi:MAG: hypothetical protein ACK5AZ_22330, partial [Bryobacteraceae bacterium]
MMMRLAGGISTLWLLIGSVVLVGQVNTGSINGTIFDPNEAAIPADVHPNDALRFSAQAQVLTGFATDGE